MERDKGTEGVAAPIEQLNDAVVELGLRVMRLEGTARELRSALVARTVGFGGNIAGATTVVGGGGGGAGRWLSPDVQIPRAELAILHAAKALCAKWEKEGAMRPAGQEYDLLQYAYQLSKVGSGV